ncbi:uncharacterized protein LOC121406831 [Lytechinus variegatus]|uniref:uncharacterized protein LOC121406831 n=1 Tax=Lytechinus variegatus TaxID=7654 RepID=UPI001BB20FAE|nr:uncharacterized protein LOC121406831 [Lytechinus variegatus]
MGTFNCRGAQSNNAFISRLLEELDILLIQEHWLYHWDLNELANINDNFQVFSISQQNNSSLPLPRRRAKGGVATFIRTSSSWKATKIESQSQRLIITDLLHEPSNSHLIICNGYFPCDVDANSISEYHHMLSTISHIETTHKEALIILGGDLNADLTNASCKKPTKRILKEFLISENMINLSSLQNKKELYTFQSDDGLRHSYIDDFIIPAKLENCFSDLLIEHDDPLNTSDHTPVKVTFSLPLLANYQVDHDIPDRITGGSGKFILRPKIFWHQCSADQRHHLYTLPMEQISKKLFFNLPTMCLDPTKIDLLLDQLSKEMLKVSLTLPHSKGRQKRKRKGKREWTKKVEACYKQSQHYWRLWRASGKPKDKDPLWIKHIYTKRLFRSSIRQARRMCHNNLLSEIEDAKGSNDKLFYRLVKRTKGSRSTDTLSYRGTTYEGEAVLDGFNTYFSDLAKPDYINASSPPEIDEAFPTRPFQDNLNQPLQPSTSKDLDEAINSLKKQKAAGPDNISPEHLIYLGPIARKLLLALFNRCISLKYIPEPLKSGLIVPVHKGKGKDVKDPSNYRGITVSSTIGKVLEMLIKSQLEIPLAINDVPDQLQFGFQKGKSCLLTASSLELIIQLNSAKKCTTYLALLDAQKAFDIVWHKGLFSKLQNLGLHESLLSTLEEFYNGSTSRVIFTSLDLPYSHVKICNATINAVSNCGSPIQRRKDTEEEGTSIRS